MLNRILTGIILAVLLLVTLLFSHPFLIGTLFTLIFIYSYYEWLNISCKNIKKIYSALFLMLIMMYMLLEFSSTFLIRNLTYFSLSLWLVIILTLLFNFNYLKNILTNNPATSGFLLIIISWYMTVSIGSTSMTIQQDDSYLIFSSSELFPLSNYYLFIIILVSLSDISGYVVGKLLGKRKLCKSISPNKTYEGFIASLIFPTLIFYCYFILFKSYPLLITDILFMLLCCIYCTIGDLLVSTFKRCFNVKDTGNLLPGHGGILDRLDSYLPVIAIIQFWIFI